MVGAAATAVARPAALAFFRNERLSTVISLCCFAAVLSGVVARLKIYRFAGCHVQRIVLAGAAYYCRPTDVLLICR
jgi:hypothetical protein